MKILITGAGGLLGRCMNSAFIQAGHEVVAARHRALNEADPVLDILNESDCVLRVGQWKPDWIVNCAAQRNPDRCVTHPEEAYRLNALAVEYLARAATRHGAGLCHISSDYVFSGAHPPYSEDDSPLPTIIYGRSKLAGEFAARSTARHLVIRIPALYRLDLADPANVVANFAKTLRAKRELQLDAETARYYTMADEVAAATEFLLSRDTQGIVHLSSQEKSTKADFATAIARAIGADMDLVKRQIPDPAARDRPLNTHLSTVKYQAMGGPAFTRISEAMKRIRST